MGDIPSEIERLIVREVRTLSPRQRAWFLAHRVSPPRLVSVANGIDSNASRDLWLVTDHTGDQDASSRIVFDAEANGFGVAMDFVEGPALLFLMSGGLAEALEAM
ncbi:hypothetical protein [Gaopeijia maritima]|uniref:SMI1/KNR4 family protein n=1 Tax=Gaopeijia maritima TaxID=3119007 RepID=A0ABU9ECX5_9BACT